MTRRKQLTIVHKANVLKETCGLFREVAFDLASNYPELTVNELLVDTCAMMMAMDSIRFDVIVTSNLFGDILSDLAAGLTGGPGLAPSANVGNGVPLFEPVHGSAPDIAGQGIADPRAAILSAALLLKTLAYIDEASQLERAVYRVITHNRSLQETLEQLMQELA
jgi:isocitrate/isopropylmalate dehydrogenase